MRAFFRITRTAASSPAARKIAEEFVQEAVEDQTKEKMFPGSNVQTGLPTRGGAIYTGLKTWYKSETGHPKQLLNDELQTYGISADGASKITEGKDPDSHVDQAVFVRVAMDEHRLIGRTRVADNVEDRESVSSGEVMAAAIAPSGVEE